MRPRSFGFSQYEGEPIQLHCLHDPNDYDIVEWKRDDVIVASYHNRTCSLHQDYYRRDVTGGPLSNGDGHGMVFRASTQDDTGSYQCGLIRYSSPVLLAWSDTRNVHISALDSDEWLHWSVIVSAVIVVVAFTFIYAVATCCVWCCCVWYSHRRVENYAGFKAAEGDAAYVDTTM